MDEEDDIIEPPEKRLRVPRRTPRACKQCRQAKIKCSGSLPCSRCARRREACVFPSDEPHVSVPERYLKDLEKRVAKAKQKSANGDQPFAPTLHSASNEAHADARGDSSLAATTIANAANDSRDHLRNASHSLDALAEASSAIAAAVPQGDDQIPSDSGVAADDVPDVLSPRNPLVSRSLPFVRDAAGRPHYLGPTSTWAFCRRALLILGPHSPGAHEDCDRLNNDGAAFRLRWDSKPSIDHGDLNNLPPADYALYLYNSVKFRLGELFGILDETSFMTNFERFHREPWQVACSQRLWFVEYLLILAYGKALLSHPGGRTPVPGSDFAARAMALLPDAAQLYEEGIPAIEVLALVALYFQSIDMRATAYQYIGQALRLCYVEGIHLHIPDDEFSPEFSKRCHKVWWVVYVLDRELSALMGAITPVADDNVTAFVAPERQTSILDRALMLRVRLSRLIADTCTTLYSVDDRFGSSFVRNTTGILHRLAGVSHEIDGVMTTLNQPAKSETPHMLRRIMLSYHHCIVLATRPLIMWLLMRSLPPERSEPQQLAVPIAALLHAAVDSATNIIMMLKSLTERGLLETFLPFQLEYAFSSGMLLSIIGSILPSYITDLSWNTTLQFVLDEMTAKANVVAPLRKKELEALHRLLDPVRTQEPLIVPGPNDFNLFGQQNDQETTGEGLQLSTADAGDTSGFYMPWDSMYDMGQSGQPELMLELAAQLETGDFDPSYLLGPIDGNVL
ncbi:hypothetical protein Slin15195_G119110 [Septoria linicola]|uniref:Zn(2)-C6 fungal-type domain-containing protein n=1 Tax=Septoria linicola TaxID=215465 RepID=A0A9Q9EQA6_9PEZI|nr:hypothetical protein Slin15195_G119110 [Septoria linicola]